MTHFSSEAGLMYALGLIYPTIIGHGAIHFTHSMECRTWTRFTTILGMAQDGPTDIAALGDIEETHGTGEAITPPLLLQAMTTIMEMEEITPGVVEFHLPQSLV